MAQRECVFEKVVTLTFHLSYLLFVPQGYGQRPEKKWPLILFLHGAGERGDDLDLVRKHGIPKIVETQEDFPFIVVSPQCAKDRMWEVEALNALLDEVVSNYAIDGDRIYLTGLSMGGFGTWRLASAYPQRFAAITPICGVVWGARGFPNSLKSMPVWAFHGGKDPVVDVQQSKRAVKALQAIGGDARLTIYPEAGHDAWTKTYDNPELYKWFLEHTRAG